MIEFLAVIAVCLTFGFMKFYKKDATDIVGLLPKDAERWLTPEETAIVKEQQANRYGNRAFKVDPSSFFAKFVD